MRWMELRPASTRLSCGRPIRRSVVTTTNAFATRWLAPRLPRWRAAHPQSRVHVIGTDPIVALDGGEADVAIRYCRSAPSDSRGLLMRDRFHVVASPKLVGVGTKKLTPAQIVELPLVEAGWPASDRLAPTWNLWMDRVKIARDERPEPALLFHEEAHAIKR
ncbi:MAG: LysR substrate-binding domain-containing protein [Rhodoblastus sp.]